MLVNGILTKGIIMEIINKEIVEKNEQLIELGAVSLLTLGGVYVGFENFRHGRFIRWCF